MVLHIAILTICFCGVSFQDIFRFTYLYTQQLKLLMSDAMNLESHHSFKAKYIPDHSYFRLKRQLNFNLLGLTTIVPLFSYLISTLDTRFFIFLALFLFFLFRTIWSAVRMRSKVTDATIEINAKQIRITDNKSGQKEIISLSDLTQICINPNYEMPGESFKYAIKELFGTPERNFIDIQQGYDKRRLFFITGSHYQINKFNTLIHQWKEKEYTLSYFSASS